MFAYRASSTPAIQPVELALRAKVQGAMVQRISTFNWRKTELGPLPYWQPSLRIAVDMMLLSPFPSAVVWGGDMTVIHNDGYAALLNARDDALGKRFDTVWETAWGDIGPKVFKVMESGIGLLEANPRAIQHGDAEASAWYLFSYTPLFNEQHEVAGMLHTAVRTMSDGTTLANGGGA